jgi:beta-glucosidase
MSFIVARWPNGSPCGVEGGALPSGDPRLARIATGILPVVTPEIGARVLEAGHPETSDAVEERVEGILARMTLEEKAALMFQTPLLIGEDGGVMEEPFHSTRQLVVERGITHFNIYQAPPPRALAAWHNAVQRLTAETRLGIPVTISSDPRHSFNDNFGASVGAVDFSQWPEPIGLAATRDEELVREFGDIARQEYRAVGLRCALHPMADLATEPRWPRAYGTFGEDAELAGRMVAAYIRGFQGDELGPHSVACMTKHFPGGGPQQGGEDPHFHYGKDQVYPGDNFEHHLLPFEAAFAAGTAQIMPYYGRPLGTEHEEVGFGFNRGVITGLLRERYGFDGVVCTDWGLLTDDTMPGNELWPARCWGVEHLSLEERMAKAVDAGVDQFGGESCADALVGLVREGRIAEQRIDESARRLLRDKVRLGLFDDPYVDEEAAGRIVGQPAFVAAGERAQRKAIVLLENRGAILPLQGRPRLYVENVRREVAERYAEIVDRPEDADVALIRLRAPYEPREGFLQQFFHCGSLAFPEEELTRILAVLDTVPTVVDVFLDRAAVIPELAQRSAALLASFGASDAAVLDVATGVFAPTGKLPFELPSSMAAVEAQRSDVPFDSADPVYEFGHGLSY